MQNCLEQLDSQSMSLCRPHQHAVLYVLTITGTDTNGHSQSVSWILCPCYPIDHESKMRYLTMYAYTLNIHRMTALDELNIAGYGPKKVATICSYFL